MKIKKLAILFLLLISLPLVAFSQSTGSQTATYTPFTKTLRLNSKGEEVRTLQVFLKNFPDFYPTGKITGRFDKKTQKALQKFQKEYSLKETGNTDKKTRSALNNIARRSIPATIASQGAGAEGISAGLPPLPEPAETITQKQPPKTLPNKKPYFTYGWRASEDLAGEVSLPTPVPKPVFVYDGEKTVVPQTNASVRLAELYNVFLVDDEEKWDENSSGMLLEMIARLPKSPFEAYRQTDKSPWKISLTNTEIANDVEINGKNVKIYKPAFARSNPTLQPKSAGNSDRVFYSNRLFRVVLRAFYYDRDHMAEVIRARYGLALGLADPADEFQSFTIEETQFLASVFEDLPSGFRGIPGLEKIVRRKNGLKNPDYPNAAALAHIERGYMEFMDIAFTAGNRGAYIESLIAHEMTHFLWHKVLSQQTQQEFMALSGWTKTPGPKAILSSEIAAPDHPKSTFTKSSADIWYRTTNTNFVSDYSAAHNPDEDFAETIAYYIYQPGHVRTIAPDKYKFVKEVVDGYEYVVLVDKKYTFQVFNLEPDLTFPGKVIGIDVEVYKKEDGNNRVVATLHLSPKFGYGAEMALARLVSKVQTYVDEYFYPVDNNKFLLRADFELSKYAAEGYWVPEQIEVRDRVDNRRYEGQTQFGWLMYMDNPDEDLEAPIADINKIKGELKKIDGEDTVRVTIPISDKNNIGLGGHSSLQHYESGQQEGRYVQYDQGVKEVELLFPVLPYRAQGAWIFREFVIFDKAGNERRYDLKEKGLTFTINTANPDYVKPTLDISKIKISAVPRKPEAPDGETDVTIWYGALDDNSGLGIVFYTLLKPNGDQLYGYDYHDNFYTSYFEGDPKAPKVYETKLTLPPGSVPGTWILRDIILKDKAGNTITTNFVEIGITKPFKVF